MKVYFDCTHTYTTELLTGIQRVVLNVVNNLKYIEVENVDLHPVILLDDEYIYIDNLSKDDCDHGISPSDKIKPKRVFVQMLVSYLLNKSIAHKFKVYLRKYFPALFEIVRKFYLNRKYRRSHRCKKNSNAIHIQEGDVLVVLDSAWFLPIWDAVKHFKEKGGIVIFVAYDLIPISHPYYCDKYLSETFKLYYDNVVKFSDGFISISNTVSLELKSYLHERFPHSDFKYDSFKLGSDFYAGPLSNEYEPSENIKTIFMDRNVYLMVGTIEPRKNHLYVFDSIIKNINSGCDIKLLIVGRVGWKVDEFISNFRSHPLFNKRLFLFNHLDDRDLKYCYNNSKALIFSSFIEGFGLPIVEAFKSNLPVLLSDISIHKEVAGDNALYFDINDNDSLFNLISHCERFGIDIKYNNNGFSWISWRESTEIFVQKIMKMTSEKQCYERV